MGIKNKVTGLVLAAVMVMSLAAGASAQSTTETSGTAELLPGVCSGGLTGFGGAPDFGDWRYSGGRYSLVGTNGVNNQATLRLLVSAATHNGVCDVTIGAIFLTNGTDTIGHSSFAIGLHPSGNTWTRMSATGYTYEDVENGGLTSYIRLLEVPGKASTGTYTGTITVTVSNGQ